MTIERIQAGTQPKLSYSDTNVGTPLFPAFLVGCPRGPGSPRDESDCSDDAKPEGAHTSRTNRHSTRRHPVGHEPNHPETPNLQPRGNRVRTDSRVKGPEMLRALRVGRGDLTSAGI